MKKIITLVCIALLTTGCAAPIVKTQIQTVDKPIPFIPKPPAVPKCQLLVDSLILSDLKDPGKIGQYYVYDMTCLRKTNEIYQMILDQYSQSSANFDDVNKQIDLLFQQINNNKPVN